MSETSTGREKATPSVRQPTPQDGAEVYRCLREWGGLDVNSPYAYLLACDKFGEQSAIAELDGKLVGFVMGLGFPQSPDTLFVWQVGVSPEARGMRIAGTLIEAILERTGSRFLEAHVGAENKASEALFRGIARRLRGAVQESVAYPSEWFPPGHDTERLLRIGPFEGK